MSNSAYAEIYFITAMMILILVICSVAVYFFFKTYKKEMDNKKKREVKAESIQNQKVEIKNQNVSS